MDAYFCLRLVPVEGAELPPGLSLEVVRQTRESERRVRHPGESPGGRPVATTWLRLVTVSANLATLRPERTEGSRHQVQSGGSAPGEAIR